MTRRTRRVRSGAAGLLALTLALAGCASLGGDDAAPGEGGGGTDGSDGGTTTSPTAPGDPVEPTEPGDDVDPDTPVDDGGGTGEPTDPGDGPGARPEDAPPADLTIRLDVSGEGDAVTYRLTCDPVGGDHPDPDGACAALADAGGASAFARPPRDEICTEIWGGPQVAEVTGTVGDAIVQARFSRSNGCEIARWDALAPLLGDRGGAR